MKNMKHNICRTIKEKKEYVKIKLISWNKQQKQKLQRLI